MVHLGAYSPPMIPRNGDIMGCINGAPGTWRIIPQLVSS